MTEDKDNQQAKELATVVVSEMVRQTGELGNYILKATVLILGALLPIFSVGEFFALNLSNLAEDQLFPSNLDSVLIALIVFSIIVAIWWTVFFLALTHLRLCWTLAIKLGGGDHLYIKNPQIILSTKLCRAVSQLSFWLAQDNPAPVEHDRLPRQSLSVLQGVAYFSVFYFIVSILTLVVVFGEWILCLPLVVLLVIGLVWLIRSKNRFHPSSG